MDALTTPNPRLPASRDKAWRVSTAVWGLAAFGCLAFAVMAGAFAGRIGSGAHDLWALIQARFTSDAYTYGPGSGQAVHPLYLRAFKSLSVHAVAGALALAAATSQFVPAFRHRLPVAHRIVGMAVVVLVVISMTASAILVASHPLAASLSGAAFTIGLVSLCGATLAQTALAVAAVRARCYRVHMGWMALMFASLLTAPLLRVQWLLAGLFPGWTMAQANLCIVMFLVPESILIMTLWMTSVGARDLGLLPTRSILPPIALRTLAIASAIVALHEGLLAPFGVDLLAHWREAALHLPRTACLWALAMSALAYRVPDDLRRLGDGRRVRPATIAIALSAALGSLLVAWTFAPSGLQGLAQRTCYGAWGIEVLLLVAACRGAGRGIWDAQWLHLAFVPALWPLLAASYLPLHIDASIVTTTAMGVGYASIAMLGFASAFGLRVVTGVRHEAGFETAAA